MTIEEKNLQIKSLKKSIRKKIIFNLILVIALALIIIFEEEMNESTYILITMIVIYTLIVGYEVNKHINIINGIKDQYNFQIINDRLQFGNATIQVVSYNHTKDTSKYVLKHQDTLYIVYIKDDQIQNINQKHVRK